MEKLNFGLRVLLKLVGVKEGEFKCREVARRVLVLERELGVKVLFLAG